MGRRAIRGLLSALPTLLAVVVLSFFLMRLAPGGPFDKERPLDPVVLENLRRIYKLDLPLHEQFFFYLNSLLHGDLGPSFHWRDFTVNELFARALPVSMTLGLAALALALVVGLAMGITGASQRHSFGAALVDGLSILGVAVPGFVIAPVLQLVFGLGLHWLPVGGWNDGHWRNAVLPVITLALPQIAAIARLTRASMLDVWNAPHLRTLRAFGMPRHVLYAHAFRGAALPVLSYLGPAAAGLLTGSVVVETIFGIPGIGRHFVDGALNRDYPLVMGTVIIVAVLVIVLNFLVDLAYGLIDPRVRHE